MSVLSDIFNDKASEGFVEIGAYQQLGHLKTEVIPLDRMLSGGLPIGRMVEIHGAPDSGKTTMCLQAAKSAQKQGWLVAYFDLEYKLDPESAINRIGLERDNFAVIKPKNAEQAVELLIKFLEGARQHEKHALAIVDSIPSLVPASEMDKDIDENRKIGYLSQFISKMEAIIKPLVWHTESIVIFTNQIRASMGPMGGCFVDKTHVWHPDMNTTFIGSMVREQMQNPVLSFDKTNQTIVQKTPTNFFNNGPAKEAKWVRITTEHFNGTVALTNKHIVPTDRGDIPAEEVKPGDKVVTCFQSVLAKGDGAELLIGMLLAGTANIEMRSPVTARIVIKPYTATSVQEFAIEPLKDIFYLKTTDKGFRSKTRTDLNFLYRKLYGPQPSGSYAKVIPDGFKLTPLMGYCLFLENFNSRTVSEFSFNISSLMRNHYKAAPEAEKFCQVIREFLENTGVVELNLAKKRITLDDEAFAVFSRKIEDWCLPSVRSYLHDSVKPTFSNKTLNIINEVVPYWATVSTIAVEHEVQRKGGDRFDIEVPDTHAYFVGSEYPILVHNSSTPGGWAAKHMMSVRMKLEKKEAIEGKEKAVVGQKSTLSLVKNHVSGSVRMKIDIDVMRAGGISVTGALIDELEYLGFIKKSGAWYKWEAHTVEQFGVVDKALQGRNGAIDYLVQNPEMAEKLYDHLLSIPL